VAWQGGLKSAVSALNVVFSHANLPEVIMNNRFVLLSQIKHDKPSCTLKCPVAAEQLIALLVGLTVLPSCPHMNSPGLHGCYDWM
jgi:hypothetical protein